jgi:magnesium chelatase subunit I
VTPPDYRDILEFFSSGGKITLEDTMSAQDYQRTLRAVPGLVALVDRHVKPANNAIRALASEWVLESLHQASLIARQNFDGKSRFHDVLADMFSGEVEA